MGLCVGMTRKQKTLKYRKGNRLFTTKDISSYFKKGKENKPANIKQSSSRLDRNVDEIRDENSQENYYPNLLFYKNRLKSKPDGDYIENILKDWQGDYLLLERHHGYIQWLFPLREDGMNWHAEPLLAEEMDEISNSDELKKRMLRAYKMMLDFYGFVMVDDATGRVQPNSNHSKRIMHLKKSRHNFLRITRILKSLKLMGLGHIGHPFLGELVCLSFGEEAPLSVCQESCLNFWIPTVSDEKKRRELKDLAESLNCEESR